MKRTSTPSTPALTNNKLLCAVNTKFWRSPYSCFNAVKNISAMFILKTQHDYVEATKVVIEPSKSLLGQPKSVEEIADYIDADIVED